MAGAGYKLFATGDVLTAAEVNTYLMQQAVMVFDDSAARTTALSGVVAEGMLSYLKDTNAVEVYDGANWVASDDPNAIQNSIVDAKGDLISASADNVPARLAVGNNGETLVADSSTTTGLRWQGDYAAGKSKIINGDFGIWQRGTSITLPNNTPTYGADRFIATSVHSSGTATFSQQSFTAGTAPVAGYEGTFFGRLTAGAAGSPSAYLDLSQRIEDVRTFASQTITLSFWAKASVNTSLNPLFRQHFGSGGSANADTSSSTATATTSWARYSFTVTLPSISGKTIGTGNYLQVYLFNGNYTNSQTIDIWGVQVEAGSVATAFQTATGTLAGELSLAQRYYQKSYPQGTAPATSSIFQGAAYGSTDSVANNGTIGQVRFTNVMRAAPSVTMYSYSAGTANVVSNAAGIDQAAGSGAASGIGDSGFGIYNTSGGTVTLTNGYVIHYVASAEL